MNPGMNLPSLGKGASTGRHFAKDIFREVGGGGGGI